VSTTKVISNLEHNNMFWPKFYSKR